MPVDQTTTEYDRSRFMKEVIDTITTSRKCDGVVKCYGYSILRSGQLVLVMKLYERGTLRDLLEELQRE